MPVVSKRSVFCDGFVAAGKELLLEAVINQTGGAKVTTMSNFCRSLCDRIQMQIMVTEDVLSGTLTIN